MARPREAVLVRNVHAPTVELEASGGVTLDTIEAIAKGQNRILLVMATGTGKTFTAFQIIWRLWKSKKKKRILFLADRNILVDQTMTNDFKPFAGAMTKIKKRQANKSYEIYLSLYQAVTGNEEEQKQKKSKCEVRVSNFCLCTPYGILDSNEKGGIPQNILLQNPPIGEQIPQLLLQQN